MNALGEIEIEKNNYEAAISYFEQGLAMETVTDRQELMANSILAYEYAGEFDKAYEMAQEYVKLGYHIGLGGVVTFKNAKKAKETARQIPLERILLETDCPYMAPTPFRGKRNNSAYIDYVAQEIADLKGISKEEVIAVTEENAKKLFAIISVENTPTSASGE